MGIFKRLTLVNKGLRYKLMVAFSLMSIIPLLACMYIISVYLFPQLQSYLDVSGIVLISIIIAILGLVLAKGLVDPVIDMAIEAKIIANGEFDRRVPVATDDEIGNLGQSINLMTQKIKTNLDELKNYGQKMREINVDIHKKVLALSSLLQIGDILSSGSIKLDPLLDMAVEKASMVFDGGYGVLYMSKDEGGDLIAKTTFNLDTEKLDDMIIKRSGDGIIDKAVQNRLTLMIDKTTKMTKDLENLTSRRNLKNIVAIPIHSGKKALGVLLIGNRVENFQFRTDDVDLVKVFAKQIAIAIESDILNKKTEELAIKDDLTDLYNKTFILNRLEEEIKRAIFYQRPCSFIIFNIDGFKKFIETHGELVAEEALRRVAKLIKENTNPVGKAARVGGNEFAMLLPEKNKKEATQIAEDIRKKIESTNLLREGTANVTVSAGVSENPIDGATADELFKKAIDAVKRAKTSGKNCVAV